MMITGRIWKDGNDWLAKSEAIDVCTQGTAFAASPVHATA